MSEQEQDTTKQVHADLQEEIAHREEQRRQRIDDKSKAERQETFKKLLEFGPPVVSMASALVSFHSATSPAQPVQVVITTEPGRESTMLGNKPPSTPTGDVAIVRIEEEPVTEASGEQGKVGAERQQSRDIEQSQQEN